MLLRLPPELMLKFIEIISEIDLRKCKKCKMQNANYTLQTGSSQARTMHREGERRMKTI